MESANRTLKKANSAKFAIKMIAKYFSKKELNDIITACYFSIFYYNADIWMIPTLSSTTETKTSSSIFSSTKNLDQEL